MPTDKAEVEKDQHSRPVAQGSPTSDFSDFGWSKEHCNEVRCTYDTALPTEIGDTVRALDCRTWRTVPDTFQSPVSWSPTRKWLTTILCYLTLVIAVYAAGAYSATEQAARTFFNVSSLTYTLGITMYTFGFGLAPMVLAPLSEVVGRRPVLISCAVLMMISQVVCLKASQFSVMLMGRLMTGMGASAFSTVTGGVIADIWPKRQQEFAISLLSVATMIGTTVGPVCSAFLVKHRPWRWVFSVQIGFCAVLTVLLYCGLKESRSAVVLQQRCLAINTAIAESRVGEQASVGHAQIAGYQNEAADPSSPPPVRYVLRPEDQMPSAKEVLRVSCTRTFKIAFGEPIVWCFSAWISFANAILYMLFGAIPLLFHNIYGFSVFQANMAFAAVAIGGIIAGLLSIGYEYWRVSRIELPQQTTPEDRLMFTCLTGQMLPIGLFLFAGTCSSNVPWMVPVVALGLVSLGICSVFLSTFTYITDVYKAWTSSALAVTGLCRNIAAGLLPLISSHMFVSLGTVKAGSILGAAGLIVAGGPFLLLWYGPMVRSQSTTAQSLVD